MEAARAWFEKCDDPSRIEYVLSVHESRWAAFREYFHSDVYSLLNSWASLQIICNRETDTAVSQGNACGMAARGALLVSVNDDLFPPDHWDTLLIEAAGDLSKEAVLHCTTGSARDNDLFIPQIMTAARRDRLGYCGWPEYISMFCDDEFTEHARRDGVVVDARHVRFLHRHPALGLSKMDEVYESENKGEAYRVGREIFERRRAAGFPSLGEGEYSVGECVSDPSRPAGRTTLAGVASQKPAPVSNGHIVRKISDVIKKWREPVHRAEAEAAARRKTIAVCTPGQTFSNLWVDSFVKMWTQLVLSSATGALGGIGSVHGLFGYSTNVNVTRMGAVQQMEKLSPNPDYVLWIDDDNLVSFDQVSMLLADLDAAEREGLADMQMVCGWCWMKCEDLDAERKVSCGYLNQHGGEFPISYEDLMADAHDLIELQWSGFPVVLMKWAAIDRAGGVSSFAPIMDARRPWGFAGEDMAFCQRYREAGGRLFVDRRVKVPHLKLQPAEPRGSVAPPVSVSV